MRKQIMPKIDFRYPRAIAVALFSLICLAALPRSAGAQDAGAFVANLGTQAIQVLGPSVPPAERAERFRQLFQNDFDLPGIARFVLGPNARGLTEQQQQEFVGLYRESLVQAYSKRLAEYAGAPFRVTGSRSNSDETVVTSQVVRAGSNPIEIDWHLINRDGRYLITDVSVDGVSMKMTQRSEFAGIIQRNGGRPDSLLAALRQQVAEAR
jgi:phospholipid transport system substrate-binding protein